MRTTTWLLLGLLLLLTPARGLAQYAELEGRAITAVRVAGNLKIETAAILQNIGARPGYGLREQQIRKDVKDIYALGFFEDVQVYVEEAEDGLILTYRVEEKPAIESIQFEGQDKVNLDDLKGAVTLRLYTILDENAVSDAVAKLQALYAEKGYYLAEVKADVRPREKGGVDVVFKIQEGQKVLVKRTYYVGDDQVKAEEFEKFLQNQNAGYMYWLSSSGTFNEQALEDDMMIISAYYYDKGYVQVRVEPPEVYLSPDRTYLAITWRIHEGERYKISRVDVDGDLIAPREELMELVQTREGEYFNRTLLSQDIQALSDKYSDQGFAFAEVYPATELDDESKTIAITYQLATNRKVYLNKIDIGGNTVTWDKTIRREILLNEGEMFRGSVVKDAKRRLERLGYFEEVNITTPKVDDERLDLKVQVKEKPTGSFNVGAGVSSAENFVFNANISKQNFLGLGYIMGAAASVSQVRQQVNLSFYDPYFLDSRWTFRVDGYNVDQSFYQDEYRRGVSTAFGHYIGINDDALVQLKYSFEQQGVNNLSEYLLQLYGGQLFRGGDSSSVEVSFTVDKRNNRITPTAGWRLSASSELTGGFALTEDELLNLLGGDFFFHRHQFNFRFYYPFIEKKPDALVFRFNSTLGAIWSTDGTMVPLLQRYRAGGINSVRGFQIYSLGPTTRYLSNYEPAYKDLPRTVGGYQIMTNNIELEFSILREAGIRGVVFFDAGNAFDLWGFDAQAGTDEIEYRSDKLPRFSTGFGFRWFSPMGPLRFEWGFPLDRREGEARHQFEFTIGSFF